MKGRWRIAEWRRTYTIAATVRPCAVLAVPGQQNVSVYSLIKISVPFQSGFTASYRTAYRDFSLGLCFLTLTFTDMGFWIIHTHTGAWKHNPCCPTPPPYQPPSILPPPPIITSHSSYKSSLGCSPGRQLVYLLSSALLCSGCSGLGADRGSESGPKVTHVCSPCAHTVAAIVDVPLDEFPQLQSCKVSLNHLLIEFKISVT